MKPSIGRIVHFSPYQGCVLPAIIVAVVDDNNYVDLEVFGKAEGVIERYVDNVPQFDIHDGNDKGEQLAGTWQWPPRV